jgi:hypothetical protein
VAAAEDERAGAIEGIEQLSALRESSQHGEHNQQTDE